MTDHSKIARLALTFDAASMDPQVWPDVCQQVSDYFGSEGALLAAEDIGYDAGMLPYSEGVAGLMERYYAQKWYEADVRSERGFAIARRQGWVTDYTIMQEAELREHRFYNELVRPAGLSWFAATAVKVGSRVWGLSVQRTAQQGPFQRNELLQLSGLRGQLRLAIRRLSALGGRRLETLEGFLADAEHGVATIGPEGRVTRLNARAELWLSETGVLHGGRVTPPDGPRGDDLRQLLAVTTDPDWREKRLLPPPALLQSRQDGMLLIDIVRMPREFSSLAANAVALLNIRPVQAETSTGALPERFGLTRREAEIATLLATGSGLDTISGHLGMSIATTRQHLKAIFRKTGTHRQGELIAILTSQT